MFFIVFSLKTISYMNLMEPSEFLKLMYMVVDM